MSGVRPDQFPIKSTLDGSEELYTQTNGVNNKFTTEGVLQYVQNNLTGYTFADGVDVLGGNPYGFGGTVNLGGDVSNPVVFTGGGTFNFSTNRVGIRKSPSVGYWLDVSGDTRIQNNTGTINPAQSFEQSSTYGTPYDATTYGAGLKYSVTNYTGDIYLGKNSAAAAIPQLSGAPRLGMRFYASGGTLSGTTNEVQVSYNEAFLQTSRSGTYAKVGTNLAAVRSFMEIGNNPTSDNAQLVLTTEDAFTPYTGVVYTLSLGVNGSNPYGYKFPTASPTPGDIPIQGISNETGTSGLEWIAYSVPLTQRCALSGGIGIDTNYFVVPDTYRDYTITKVSFAFNATGNCYIRITDEAASTVLSPTNLATQTYGNIPLNTNYVVPSGGTRLKIEIAGDALFTTATDVQEVSLVYILNRN